MDGSMVGKLGEEDFDLAPLPPPADREEVPDRLVLVRPEADLLVLLRAGADRAVLARRFMRVLVLVRGVLRPLDLDELVAAGRAAGVAGGLVAASPGGVLGAASGVEAAAAAAGAGGSGVLELGDGDPEGGVRLAMVGGSEGCRREWVRSRCPEVQRRC